MLYWRGTNIEKLGPQFQQAMEVGDGAQHREFRKEIQQAMEVGGAPTQRNWNPNFNRQWKLGITNLILLKYHFCPTPYA
ncbi:hypothetical protein BJL72_08605 [Staphylococcus aureus]|nr:hypothetical protein BJL72_08605 [Staphylococcus aureus]RCV82771.1 hypothetical protein BJL73_08620 [Staphylococcus aureus]